MFLPWTRATCRRNGDPMGRRLRRGHRIRPRLYAIALLLAAQLVATTQVASTAEALELQGHRGARGLWPENTLAAFSGALRLGVDVLELDLALTADDVVVVSHDPRLSPALARGPGGQWLPGDGPAIRTLSLASLRTYDVGRAAPGSRVATRFPEQKPADGQRVPTLAEVFALAKDSGSGVRFNIEIKHQPAAADGLYPNAEHFARRVVDTVAGAGMSKRVMVQGFDWRPLAAVRRLAPDIPVAALTAEQRWLDNVQRGVGGASPWTAGLDVDDYNGSVPELVARFGAEVWSPYFRDVNASSIAVAQGLGLRVIVWTVNDVEDMQRLINLGVDGIITDYPDRLRSVMSANGLPLPTPVR